MESDSDDGEEEGRLRAALDPAFFGGGGGGNGSQAEGTLGNGVFLGYSANQEKKIDGVMVQKELPPSKRAEIFNSSANSERVHPYGLQVPPGRKNFIAKHLVKYLDEKTKLVSPPPGPVVMEDQDAGVRMFSNSTEKLTVRDLEAVKSRKKKKRKRQHSSSDSEEANEKLKSVAVSFEWVMKQ